MAFDHAPYLRAIEDDLHQALACESSRHAGLYDMLRYHLGWQDSSGIPAAGGHGKRLRPLLCLLACEAVGGSWESAVPAATALELIHNFTLIHDDLEDDSPLRHQRPTVWSVWGAAQAINAGDALWALARQSMYRLPDRGTEPTVALRVARLLDEACLQVFEGQYLDIASEGDRELTVQTYEQLVQGKTVALIVAALVSGALLGGAGPTVLAGMERFGQEMGLAFQMTDDLLGIWGDPQVTGKSTATDLAAHKMTLPVIHALAWERALGERTLYDLYGRAPSEEDVPALLAVLDRSGAKGAVEQRAADSQQRMQAAWDAMGLAGPAADELCELAMEIVGRQY